MDTAIATVTGTSHPVTGLTPATAYAFYVVALDAAGNPSIPSPTVTVTTTGTPTPTTPTGSCKVGYATSDWSTGFTANITITNTGTTVLTGWSLAFAFPTAGQQAGQAWSANVTQTGTAVTASNLSYNGALAPRASTSFGFNGTHPGTNPKPTTFTLNGSPCTIA